MIQQEFVIQKRNMLMIWKYLPTEIVEFILRFIQKSDSSTTCVHCEWVGDQEWFLDDVCLQCRDYIDGNGSEIEYE